MDRSGQKEERVVYFVLLGMLAFCIPAFVLIRRFSLESIFLTECPFHAAAGLYCPGCGGSRAAAALLSGDVVQSFLLHPLVPYLAFFAGSFLISQTVSLFSGGRIDGMRLDRRVPAAAAVITLLNWIWKNAALLIAGRDLLAEFR